MADWTRRGMGWLPDYPDFRDYTPEHDVVGRRLTELGQTESIKKMLAKVGAYEAVKGRESLDLREWCSPVEDQGQLGSCTANAAAGLVEYFERKAFGGHIEASRLFLYKATRNLLGLKGDTGAFLRSTMGAMVLFGMPPEERYPYDVDNFDEEPSGFYYAFGQSYRCISYYRLDEPAMGREELLDRIKAGIAKQLPAMFGFTVYGSIEQATETGKIPFPAEGERVAGGHAVAAVGYDDKLEISNSASSKTKTTGALLIRNSWGPDWGEDGYGWLPYEYVLKGLATDWWSLLKNEWVDTGQFGE